MGVEPSSKQKQSIIVSGPCQSIITNQSGGSFQSVIIGPRFPQPVFPPPLYPPPPFLPPPFLPQRVYKPPVYNQPSNDDESTYQRRYVPPKEIKKYVEQFKDKNLRDSKVNIDWVK